MLVSGRTNQREASEVDGKRSAARRVGQVDLPFIGGDQKCVLERRVERVDLVDEDHILVLRLHQDGVELRRTGDCSGQDLVAL